MTMHVWWFFAVTVFLLSGTPGPNMLHVLSRSVHVGFQRSLSAMAGCASAVFVTTSLSALGVGTLLSALPWLFDVIRYAGAAYLVWLGIKAWRSSFGQKAERDEEAPLRPSSGYTPWQLYRGGFLIGISNPKLLLFAVAFFPQFLDRHYPQLPQFAILIATFLCCEAFWLLTYGLGGHSFAGMLNRPAMKRLFDRFTGTLFMGFGALLLRTRH